MNEPQVGAKCSRKVASGRKVAGAIKFLVTAKSSPLDCVRVLHDALPIPVLLLVLFRQW